jgi:hypothetical protein
MTSTTIVGIKTPADSRAGMPPVYRCSPVE